MTEFHPVSPDIDVSEDEYKRLLGYPRQHRLRGRARELADWARQWYSEHGRPWVYVRETDRLDLAHGRLQIDGVALSSRRLHRTLAQTRTRSARLVAVSAGPECEEETQRLWRAEEPDAYFFLEVYGSAVVEHLIMTTGARFCAWADSRGLAVLPHFSPGYSGWNIADQDKLLRLIARGRALPRELRTLETGMLKPKKSLLAVFGISADPGRIRDAGMLMPCKRCALAACHYRRVPCRAPRSPIEDVGRLQSPGRKPAAGRAAASAAGEPRYTVSHKALQKWSRERLQLEVGGDCAVKARFRYDGTTCSDLGHPLHFEYTIKLAGAADGHRILEMSCAPAADDRGHCRMCQFSRQPDLLEVITAEKPLLGRPLGDIAAWQRQTNASGCYCTAASRECKWGQVLEVVHFALTQRETERVGKNGDFEQVL